MNAFLNYFEKSALLQNKMEKCGITRGHIDEAWALFSENIVISTNDLDISSIEVGKRPSLIVGIDDRKYVVHFPRKGESWRKANRLRIDLKLNNPFEIAETQNGILLEYFANNSFKWTDEVIIEIIKKLADIHNRNVIIDMVQSRSDYISDCEKKCAEVCIIPDALLESFHNMCKNYDYYYLPKLCHGDLWNANVLLWKNNDDNGEKQHPYLIDWEQICMGDPFYDIAKLYVSVMLNEDADITDPYEWLKLYLNDDISVNDFSHYNFMLLNFYYVAILHELRAGHNQEDEIDHFMRMIEEFNVNNDFIFEGGKL